MQLSRAEIEKRIAAQHDYCKKNLLPFFAPKDGMCYTCHKQIFNWITPTKASSELITGCPYCHSSYVE